MTKKVPLGQAAFERRVSREVLLRRIMIGEVQGTFERGRWFVTER